MRPLLYVRRRLRPPSPDGFAILVAGGGFDPLISTEFDTSATDYAGVYGGDCIAVCPTGP